MSDKYGRPSPSYERFCVYANGDGTHHVLVIAGDGGYIFADGFNMREEAEWTAALLNAAIGWVSDDTLISNEGMGCGR